MATILQPYNDWRERAIVNFVGPIIGDWIQHSREAENNRKQNALTAKVLQDINGNNSESLINPMPSQNNGNSWEEAARNGFNPLEQFDLGTADVAQATAQPQQARIPTMAEMTQAFARNIGDKRFSMLNPENAMKLFEPYMQANEAARIEQRKSKLVDTLKAAKDAEERRNALWHGYIMGDVPIEGLNAAQNQYQYENPYMENWNYNDGKTSHFGYRNPRNGEISDSFQIQNNLTPQQVQAGQQFDKNMQFQREGRAFDQDYKTRQQNFLEEQARFTREHPELKPQYGDDGTLYYINPYTGEAVYSKTPDGEIVKVDPDSYSKNYWRSNSLPSNWTKADAAWKSSHEEEIKDLQRQRSDLERQRANDIQDEETHKKYDEKISEINKQIAEKRAAIEEYINNRRNSNTNQSDTQKNTARYLYPNGQPAYSDYDIALMEENIRKHGTATFDNGKTVLHSVDELHSWLRSKGFVDVQYQPQPTENKNTPSKPPLLPESNDTQATSSINSNDIQTTGQIEKPANRSVSTGQGWRPSYQRIPQSVAMTKPVQLSTNEENERIATQGDTGATIAHSNEQQALAPLNGDKTLSNNYSGDEYNSEIMWQNPDGRTISKSEYHNRLARANISDDVYNQWLEHQGFRRADNSNSPAPPITDVITQSTPQDLRAQLNHLNGYDSAPIEETGTTFLGQHLPGLTQHGAWATSTVPMGFNDGNYDFQNLPFVNTEFIRNLRNLPPSENTVYAPYDPFVEDEFGNDFHLPHNEADNISSENFRDFNLLPIVNRRNSSISGNSREKSVYLKFRKHIDSNANRYGVDKNLIRAIIQVESSGNPNATGPKTRYGSAKGLMQLIDSTARSLGVHNSYDPAQNIMGGTKYISQLIRRYKGNIRKAVMAYNAGPGNIDKGRIPNETKKYVQKVMAIYNRLAGRNV